MHRSTEVKGSGAIAPFFTRWLQLKGTCKQQKRIRGKNQRQRKASRQRRQGKKCAKKSAQQRPTNSGTKGLLRKITPHTAVEKKRNRTVGLRFFLILSKQAEEFCIYKAKRCTENRQKAKTSFVAREEHKKRPKTCTKRAHPSQKEAKPPKERQK